MTASVTKLFQIASKISDQIGDGTEKFPMLAVLAPKINNPRQHAQIETEYVTLTNTLFYLSSMMDDLQSGKTPIAPETLRGIAETIMPLAIQHTNGLLAAATHPESLYSEEQLLTLVDDEDRTSEISEGFDEQGAGILARLCRPKI